MKTQPEERDTGRAGISIPQDSFLPPSLLPLRSHTCRETFGNKHDDWPRRSFLASFYSIS